tara:strand:+ start:121 stop:300 length:180 start_codon:yes stop_codon:yes gene_type:complete
MGRGVRIGIITRRTFQKFLNIVKTKVLGHFLAEQCRKKSAFKDVLFIIGDGEEILRGEF